MRMQLNTYGMMTCEVEHGYLELPGITITPGDDDEREYDDPADDPDYEYDSDYPTYGDDDYPGGSGEGGGGDDDSSEYVVNYENGVGLSRRGQKKEDTAGWVESGGGGGTKIINYAGEKLLEEKRSQSPEMTEEQIQEKCGRMAEIANEAINRHENTHIDGALRLNPNVFDTDEEGLVLVTDANKSYELEMNAHKAEMEYYESIWFAGEYEGIPLTEEEMEWLEELMD